MSPGEFNLQMLRLREAFGPKYFGEEKTKLLWAEVEEFGSKWFERTVNYMIGNKKGAPSLSDFQASCRQHREVIAKMKLVNNPKSSGTKVSKLDGKDIKELVEMTQKAMCGQVPKNQFQEYTYHLKKVFDGNLECKECFDQGIIYATSSSNNYPNYVFKCFCQLGLSLVENWPRWDDFKHLFVNEGLIL